MNALDFMHIALGGGFVLLVIFLCVLIMQFTLILRDVSKIVEDARVTSGKIKESVLDPLKALSKITSSFGFVQDIIDKIRARYAGDEESEGDEDEDDKKNEGGFMVKKVRK